MYLTRIYPARSAVWRARLPIGAALALLVVGAGLLVASRFVVTPWTVGDSQNAVSVLYTTERGEGVVEGIVNSPLRIAVNIPWSNGSQKGTVSSITLQLLDDAGNPAQFGDVAPQSLDLRPTITITVWEYVGSVPSRPGTYRARLRLETPYDATRQQDYDLQEPRLQAVADTGPVLRSGYVFNSEFNLWIMSTDGASQKRLTYYSPQDERADSPAWSPDGSLIAFAYTPKQPSDQIPVADIWVIKSDGSGARQLVGHGPGESLLYPAWSGDGKYLYYTGEGSSEASVPMGLPVAPGDNRSINRVEISTGAHSTWMPAAQMAASGGPDGDVAYLELVPAAPDADPSTVPQKLLVARPDGSQKRQLVGENAYGLMYAPRMSPDGKWVAFSATNTPLLPRSSSFNLLKWLYIEPEVASAHVVPWDLYMVSSSGGTPMRLTKLDEDQPYPVWLDNSTLAFMGTSGLYKLRITPDGKAVGAQPTKIHAGSIHGELTWHAP